jgi:isoleucyl-tRNA synthetase
VDDVILVSESGKPMKRETDLIDVWFDSGAMPYAQWNFMGKDSTEEAKAQFESSYPADYIAEGVDQTRGWFFTLHALAVLLNESSDEIKAFNEKTGNPGIAFKNVIANGLVLDKNGQKMSKRLGNVVDPFTTIAKYGADATRWYMISNNDPWDNLKFDLEGIGESQRKFFGTLYNTYSFFAIYANIDGFVYDENNIVTVKDRTELDRWIISKLNSLIKLVSEKMDDYDPTPAARAIEEFVGDHLSNWYVRLSRRRFWKGEMNNEKKAAYETLYECLETVSQLMSSVAPFFADWLYRNLNESLLTSGKNTLQSVHLTNLKIANVHLIDLVLEEQMDYAQRISSLVLSIRKKENIKVRQPLQRILIPVIDQRIKDEITHVKDLILAEVNVKELEYIDAIDKSIKPNFKTLGKKVGAKMKEVAEAILLFDQNKIAELEQNGKSNLFIGLETIEILIEDVEILSKEIKGFKVANEGKITVALDIELDEKLVLEGIARELISKLQTMRKESGLAVMDKINVQVADNLYTNASLSTYNSYICTEILANSIQIVDNVEDGIEIDINEYLIKVKIFKA